MGVRHIVVCSVTRR